MRDEWIAMPRYKLRKNLVRKILIREPLANKTCLEIGYGAGDMLSMCSQMGLHADGYDFSPMAYQIAKNRINKNIRLYEQEKDIAKNAYDYLMAFEVLEHIQDDCSALKKFKTYLRENGKILISVPAHMSKWGNSDISVGHYRRYEKTDLKNKLISAGFNLNLIWSYGYPLSVAMDQILDRSYSGNIEQKKQFQREYLSQESGIKRKKTILNRVLSNDILLFPFYMAQGLFLTTDLGSGYIAFAEKIE